MSSGEGETSDSVQSNETETSSVPKCGKCDGPHESDNCPHFSGPSVYELQKQKVEEWERVQREADLSDPTPCRDSCRCTCLEGCCWESNMGGGGPGPCFFIACCPCLAVSMCFMGCKDMCDSTFRAQESVVETPVPPHLRFK